jgi:tryptophan-rich sensory protein
MTTDWTPPRNKWPLVGLVALCLAVGSAGSLATAASVRDWYPAIDKPGWTPPAWLFGPVWTTLYILIGIAGWRVWRLSADRRQPAWTIWWIQLALNAAWSPVFFGLRWPAGGAAVMAPLLAAILMFIVFAWSRDRVAAWLFLPYAAWVAFAAALNFSIWRMNG